MGIWTLCHSPNPLQSTAPSSLPPSLPTPRSLLRVPHLPQGAMQGPAELPGGVKPQLPATAWPPAFQPCAQSLTFSAAAACVFWVTEIAQPLGPCRPSLSSTQTPPQLTGSRGVRREQGRAQFPTVLPHNPPRAEPGRAASPHAHPFQPPNLWPIYHHCGWR